MSPILGPTIHTRARDNLRLRRGLAMTARFSSSERPELPLEQACTRLPRVCSRIPPPGSPTRRTKAAASATRLGIPGEARAGDTSLNPGGQHRGIEVSSDRGEGGAQLRRPKQPGSPHVPACAYRIAEPSLCAVSGRYPSSVPRAAAGRVRWART